MGRPPTCLHTPTQPQVSVVDWIFCENACLRMHGQTAVVSVGAAKLSWHIGYLWVCQLYLTVVLLIDAAMPNTVSPGPQVQAWWLVAHHNSRVWNSTGSLTILGPDE